MGLARGERAPSGADVQGASASETSHMIDCPAWINSFLPRSRDSEQALVPGPLGMTLEETGASDWALRYVSEPTFPLGHPRVVRQSLGAADTGSS